MGIKKPLICQAGSAVSLYMFNATGNEHFNIISSTFYHNFLIKSTFYYYFDSSKRKLSKLFILPCR